MIFPMLLAVVVFLISMLLAMRFLAVIVIMF